MKPVFRITLIIILLTIVLSIVGISSKRAWNLEDQDFVNLISVILQVQATMFAITFGFSIISIERTAEFYSSEIIYANIRESGLVRVVGTYLSSMTLSIFSILWGKQLSNQRIIIFLNIIFVPLGILTLIYYLNNTAKGITSESLLKQLAQRANIQELIKCVKLETAHEDNWLAGNFTHYPPIRGIIDIVVEAINKNNRLLAANGIEILVNLADRICWDDKRIAQELYNLNKTNEYSLKIASKLAPQKLLWEFEWKTFQIRPIFIIRYFSSLFFGLYDLVKGQDENDLALLCIKGIEASLQKNIFRIDRGWWEKIEENISFAVNNNHPKHIQEIANLLYKPPLLAYFSSKDIQLEEIQEYLHASRIDSSIPGYLERIVKTIIDGAIDPNPLTRILQFTLLTASLSILQEETIIGGVTADALTLFSKSIIEIGNTSWPDKENIYPDSVAYTCIPEFAQTGRFIVRQVYRSGFAENNDWWESFTRTYLIHSCVRPLGNYLFAEERGNLLSPLLSTARYITQEEILAGSKLQKFPTHNKKSSDTITNMFKEWFEHCPNSPNWGERRNNADLIARTICQSAYTIRNSNQQAFLTYYRSLEEAFEGTYIWHNISTCLQ